jgi:hypothetical protein
VLRRWSGGRGEKENVDDVVERALLTAREAASYLGISLNTLSRVEKRSGPAVRTQVAIVATAARACWMNTWKPPRMPTQRVAA